MRTIINSGTPSQNSNNPLYGGFYLDHPMKSIQETIVDITYRTYEGALVGMTIAGHIVTQEAVSNLYANYIDPPEKDLTCFAPNQLHSLYGATVLTGALAGGLSGVIGLNSRLCAAAASTMLLYAGLFSQELDLEPLNAPGAIASGLTILTVAVRGADRLMDVIQTIF